MAPFGWLSGWSNTGLKMTTSEAGVARSFRVYTKTYAPGTVNLGPVGTGAVSQYNVVVK